MRLLSGMIRHILRYGFFGVAIMLLVGLVMRYTMSTNPQDLGGTSVLLGFLLMIPAFVMVWLGVAAWHRESQQGWSFGSYLLCGLAIALMVSLGYALAWEINFRTMFPDFYQRYADMEIDAAIKHGVAGKRLESLKADMAVMVAAMQVTWKRFLFTALAEPMPVALLFVLGSSLWFRWLRKLLWNG
jgi:heme/copper-type cytochrome/quinol oxidase subunit 2